jgi:DNA-binding transcriptional MocR family regulator
MLIPTTPRPQSPINLQGGWPTPRLHPVKALQAAAGEVFNSADIEQQLRYGPGLGTDTLRANVAAWLNDTYTQSNNTTKTRQVTADRVAVTNGASNGLATVLQKFTDPAYTVAVWMVEPTYFLACPIFRDAGLAARIRGVPEGPDGVDLEALREAMEGIDRLSVAAARLGKTPANGYPKLYRHIVYMVPTFSNPSGKTMAMQSRRELVRLARKHDALVVCDDVYDFLRWPARETMPPESVGPMPPRIVDVDRTMDGTSTWGNAVSNGSFSKIVAPGVRVGWLEGMPDFVALMRTV